MKKLLLLLLAFILATQPVQAMLLRGGSGSGGAVVGVSMPAGASVIYSMAKVNGWTGNCMRVKRASDNATLDIGFVNGYCDLATAYTFGTSTTLSHNIIYDQSGNGNDSPVCTSNCCQISSLDNVSGQNGITQGICNIQLPTALAVSSQSMTSWEVFAPIANNPNFALHNIGAYGNSSMVLIKQADSADTILDATNGFRSVGTIYGRTTENELSVVTSSATSRTYNVDLLTPVTGLPTVPSASVVGSNVGTTQAGYQAFGTLFHFALYPTTLSQATIDTYKPGLISFFNIPTSTVGFGVWDGDSITEGTGGTNNNNVTRYTLNLLKDRIFIRNVGVFARGANTVYANRVQNVGNTYRPGLINFDVYNPGSNDLAAGTSAATIHNSYDLPYVAYAKSIGYTAFVGTVIYRTSLTAPQEAERVSLNAMRKADAVANGYTVIDYDSIVCLQNPQTCSSDGTHPTSVGYSAMGTLDAAAINPLLP